MGAQDERKPAGCRRRGPAIAVGAMVALGLASAPAVAAIVPEYDPDRVAEEATAG